MMRADILVINPNSNPVVTAGLDAALATLRFADGPSICCATLAEGPFGIESQKDVEEVALPLRRMVERDNAADAFVIACFSDPGLHVCREATRRPVFGINECGVLTALARGDRFGIIAIAAKSVARHRRYLRQMGLADRLAGERPLEMSVAETASDEGPLARMEALSPLAAACSPGGDGGGRRRWALFGGVTHVQLYRDRELRNNRLRPAIRVYGRSQRR